MELLTAAQMRAVEQTAIKSGDVTGLELMERAGRGVVEAIFGWRPELAEGKRRAVVLCGPGNNGGDGFVIARLFKDRGWTVEVFLYGNEAKLPPDAAENARRWRALGDIAPWNAESVIDADLIVDALFGGGLTRPIPDEIAAPLTDLYVKGGTLDRMVAVDAPSGMCLDSGRSLSADWDAVFAFLTVTFHCPRVGHYLADGPQYCGGLAVADIGLGTRSAKGCTRLTTAVDAAPLLGKLGSDHKYDHGHALIISGPMARTGAARLAARGALRVGAGLVTVASPPNALMENAANLTAIMLRKMDGADGLTAILEDERINAVVIGPGCGVGEETRVLVQSALSRAKTRDLDEQRATPRGPGSSRRQRTLVLDADALTSFADDPAALFALLHDRCILTPHGGEFARLFPDIAAKLDETPVNGPAYSKVDATREAAARAGCTVLYKGPDTVIARPDGRASIAAAAYERAAPWLATAGSGDVLAGMIAGLAARGFHDAAEAAAWLHQECGRHLGPGLIAEDIPEAIPDVLKTVLNRTPPDS